MAETLQPSSGRIWPYLSTRWSLRLLFSVLAAALLIAVAAIGYYQLRLHDEWHHIEANQRHHVQLQREQLADDMRNFAYMFVFMRNQLGGHLLDANRKGRDVLKQDMLAFISSSDFYDQIRFIDLSGMEVVRVDYNHGHPAIVPDDQLQYKGDRYYFTEMMGLNSGSIYISPLDLNIEHGSVELPYKPTVRFAMALFDANGMRRGGLVLNVLAESMLSRFRDSMIDTPASSMLLNRDGYWLHHPDRELEWGQSVQERSGESMAISNPQHWQQINRDQRGQFVDHGEGGSGEYLVTFDSVRPLETMPHMHGLRVHIAHDGPQWKVVSLYPVDFLKGQMQELRNRVVLVAVLALILVSSFLVIIFRDRDREDRFRRALHIRTRAMDEATGGIVICDAAQAHIPAIYCNHAFERMSGYGREEVLGHNCGELLLGEKSDPEIARAMREAVIEGYPFRGVQRNYRADGVMFWDEVSIAPVHDLSGTLTHYIAYHQDVSERMQADARQIRLLADVKKLSRSLLTIRDRERQDMAHTLHDDIGQLTTALQVHVELAAMAARDGDHVREEAVISELGILVRQLMQSVRNSLQGLRADPVEGTGLAEQLQQLCSRWQRTGLDVQLCLYDWAWSDVDELPRAMQRHIYHFMQEALSNVVRHAAATRVNIELEHSGSMLHIRVRDNGCGFNDESVKKGMGLISLRERIEAMGGRWLLDSKSGGGTIVGGAIPLADADAGE
ncbi:PAS domain S-box protein [Mariprofundus erugo]|uniref:sensor histidine kinase n=1 Tax=Mariprofundus erugo TaxID=2528639 RepID=UPI0010FD7311|nr:PAS domain S-box protein [Mariprofundus erugo]TLS75680.1 PAS domain S-box protein [Mariprofundus erugo]